MPARQPDVDPFATLADVLAEKQRKGELADFLAGLTADELDIADRALATNADSYFPDARPKQIPPPTSWRSFGPRRSATRAPRRGASYEDLRALWAATS